MAKRISGTPEYDQVRPYLRNMRLSPLGYGQAQEVQLTSKEKFWTESFIPVIDQFIVSLTERIAADDIVSKGFGFHSQPENVDASDLCSAWPILSAYTRLTWSIALVMK